MAFVIAACAGSMAPPVVTGAGDRLDEIRARGTIVIATDINYRPQSELKPLGIRAKDTKCDSFQYSAGQMTGFDVQVGIEIASSLQVEPCFVTPPWTQLVAGNWQNNWDIHSGSAAITYDRMENLYFTQPYFATPTVVLVHKDSPVSRVEDLSGLRIGVCSGCIPEKYLSGNLQLPGQNIDLKIKNAQVVAYENESPAIEDLSIGNGLRLDAVITILPIAKEAIARGLPLKILEPPLFFGYASITVDRNTNRNTARLVAEINRIVQDLHASGRLREISLQYFGMDLTSQAAEFNLDSLDLPR